MQFKNFALVILSFFFQIIVYVQFSKALFLALSGYSDLRESGNVWLLFICLFFEKYL